MIELGTHVDRYTVEARLGEGGMASVWRVRHRTLGTKHGLKLLKVQSAEIRERMVQEGRVQASLQHPNIVAVTDVLLVDGAPGLLMELVDGCSLDYWLHNTRPTLQEAEAIFAAVLSGVTRAHRLGLVHRDLKPGNVMLARTDDGIVPKVTDFGLAKVVADHDSHSATRSGVSLGTPQYMAPEQIRNAKNVDARADIWALGCILYELVCGRPPFRDDDIVALFSSIAGAQYVIPTDLQPELPDRIVQAITGCLTVDRAQRFADCAALREVVFAGVSAPLGPIALQGVEAPRVPEALVPARTAYRAAPSSIAKPDAFASMPPPERVIPWVVAVVGVGAGALALAALGGWFVWQSWSKEPDPPAEVATPAVEVATAAAPAPAPEPVPAPEPALATPVQPRPPITPRSTTAAPQAATPPSSDQVPAEASATTTRRSEPPTSPEAEPASVSFDGDATQAWLEQGGRKVNASRLKPGTYTVVAVFPGKGRVDAGTVTVGAGEQRALKCNSVFAMCR